jgi:SAM-dependent methyltransferase
MNDPTRRFSTRVDNYVKSRPGYPPEILTLLAEQCGLAIDSVIADIGSGTGPLAELFLRHGNPVIGVEPNREMREAGERLLREYSRFRSLDGTAEATGLHDASVDFVTVGQAFHWFDRRAARVEFARILRPEGFVVLVWNNRRAGTPLLEAYEQLLRDYASEEYAKVGHCNVAEEAIGDFFAPGTFQVAVFPNQQRFDLGGLRGRLLSSSYTPEIGDARHAPMLERLTAIFDAHQSDGKVVFEYDTQVFYGQFGSD